MNYFKYLHKLKTPFNFGISQIISMLFSIVKNHLILHWIGLSGLGLINMLNNALNLITTGTNLGLSTQLVKDISLHKSIDQQSFLNNNIKLSLVISVVGCFLTFVFSDFLAAHTFEDASLSWMFQWLAISVFFKQLASCIRAVLQGLQHYKSIILSNLLFSIVGFFIVLPLYYYYKEASIVPSIIIVSLVEFVFIAYFIKDVIKFKPANSSLKHFFEFSAMTINKSYVFSLINILNLLINYLLGVYILRTSDLDNYGYYSAIYIIINNYIGFIFTIFSFDYLPKLIKTETNNINKLLNDQIFIITIIISIVSIVSILFTDFIIRVLYGENFLNLIPAFKLTILGLGFKAVSWCISYLILAKSSRKTYFWLEFIFNILFITFSIIGFYFYNHFGIWLAWVLYYLLYLIIVYIIAKKQFKISIKNNLFLIFGSNLIIYTLYFLLN